MGSLREDLFGPDDEAGFRRTPTLVRVSDVQPEPVSWLWSPRIPRGKLTLCEGDPSAGKTTLALSVAAAVSNGADWPDGGTAERGTVVYMSAEDGIADTLRPRLDAAGADVSRVYCMSTYRDGESDSERSVTLKDVDVLDAALAETGAALLVVDPLQAFLGADCDFHRANETRPLLAGLSRLAEKHSCAVLVIRHLSKASGGKALYRGLGSVDFTAAARSVLLAGRNPSNPSERAIVHTKSSLAAEAPALGYEITDGGLRWTGTSTLTAAQLLGAEQSEDERGAVAEAEDFLREALAAGPRPSSEVANQARTLGLSERSLQRARQALGVRSYKSFGGKFVLDMSATCPPRPPNNGVGGVDANGDCA